jgi:hypothetical protein
MSDLSPLSGVERKLDFGAVRSVDDPHLDIGLYWPAVGAARMLDPISMLAGGPRLDDPRRATHTPYFCAMSAAVRVVAPVMLQSKNSYADASAIAASANARLS